MPLGNPNLTEKVFGASDTEPGMAYFAWTGPVGKHCRDCKFKGYFSDGSKEEFNPRTNEWEQKKVHRNGCAKYRQLTGDHGPPIRGDLMSCKYFEQKPK